ncbi:MAG: asparaginase [Calditrichia bacterium]
MKKILLMHTGGTFGMMPAEPSKTLAPSHIQDLVLTHLPEISKIAAVDFEVVFNIDSANIQLHHWQQLAGIIRDKYDEYNGFVIIHGTDAMVYSACALSFMLQGLDKPVILTGSQRPLAHIRSDARNNLISSLELATYPIPEVSIFFGTHLYRGNRTIKISSTRYEAFESPNFPPLAEVGLDVTLSVNRLKKGKSLRYAGQLDHRVFCFRFHPGIPLDLPEMLLDSSVQAVVVEGLGVGNMGVLENSILPWIEKMRRRQKLVVISSQSPFGRVDLSLYSSGHQIMEAGGVSAGDMTTTATIVKLMHLFGKFPGNLSKVTSALARPLAGEISA